jgi:hypothetical protein
MNAPQRPFSLSGELEKAIAAAPLTLEQLGADNARLSLSSRGPDVLTWSQSGRAGMIVPDDKQQITLRDAYGRRLFTGTATRAYSFAVSGPDSYAVTVTGPWKWMVDTTVESMVADETGAISLRPLVRFERQPLSASLRQLIELAYAAGCPFRFAPIPDWFPLGKVTLSNLTFEQALLKLLAFVPDAATYMDYDTDGLPVLHIVRRRDASVFTINLGEERHLCTELRNIEALPDMRPSGVEIKWVERDPVTFKPYYVSELAGQRAPTGKQVLVASGPEKADFLPPEGYEFVSLQTIKASDPTATIAAWKLLADPFLKGLSDQFGPTWASPGTIGVGDGTGVPYFPAPSPPAYYYPTIPPITQDALGNGLSPTQWFAVRSADPVPEWLKDRGVSIKEGTFITDVIFVVTWPSSGSEPTSDAIQAFRSRCRADFTSFFNSSGTTQQRIAIYRTEIPVTFISREFATLTDYWKPSAYDFNQPPPGLAANLFEAQNFTPWRGDGEFAPGKEILPHPSQLLNIMGRSKDLETMNAGVVELSIDLASGAASFKLDASAFDARQGLVDEFARSGSDNIT